jgi:hypothetical protein
MVTPHSSDLKMKLNIFDFVGENCITYEDGERVFLEIYPPLLSEQSVELDFSGVKVFASPFFNAAIGPLLKDLSPEQLNNNLHLKGLLPHGNNVLRRVIENAKQYYANPKIRESVKKVIDQQADYN